MRVKRDAEYDDETEDRPMRKYRKDASGLRVPVVWAEVREPAEPSGESVFRLAWLFVEGWRHKLRKAGDMVEKARWEWEIGGTARACTHSRASSLTFDFIVADARLRVPEEMNLKKKKRKSVHWALDEAI